MGKKGSNGSRRRGRRPEHRVTGPSVRPSMYLWLSSLGSTIARTVPWTPRGTCGTWCGRALGSQWWTCSTARRRCTSAFCTRWAGEGCRTRCCVRTPPAGAERGTAPSIWRRPLLLPLKAKHKDRNSESTFGDPGVRRWSCKGWSRR